MLPDHCSKISLHLAIITHYINRLKTSHKLVIYVKSFLKQMTPVATVFEG